MNCKNKSFMTKKKAFTLIELLIVIAIIGILFIVLVSKVDFATDKAKATGVQTDFRSFQLAFDTVAKENSGFNTFGWDTGDANQDGIRNSYDEGDNGAGGGTAQNGIQDGTEVFTGHKVYAETFTKVYSLKKNGTGSYDREALNRLETAINANLDPKLHITIADDGAISMANGARDPWNKEYHGAYISNAEVDGKDRGAIVMYSDGANNEFGSEHKISNGVVTVSIPGSNKAGKDDYSIVSVYTYVNGYGEVKNVTSGFSNNQTMLGGNDIQNDGNVPIQPETPDEPVDPQPISAAGLYDKDFNLIADWETLVKPVEDGGYGLDIIKGYNSSTKTTDPAHFYVLSNTYSELNVPCHIVVDNSVTSIGTYAFYDCTNILSITIPTSVKSFGTANMEGCTNLTDVYYQGTLQEWLSISFDHMGSPTYNGNAQGVLGTNLYINNEKIVDLVIPNDISIINNQAFAKVDSLKSIVLPSSVTKVGTYAFFNCQNLKNVTIQSTNVSFGQAAFAYTSDIVVDFVGSVSQWCEMSFYNYYANPIYNGGTLYCNGELLPETVVIGDGITNINDCVFYANTTIKNVVILNTVKAIGWAAFEQCTNLETIQMADGLTTIGSSAFKNCKNLKSLVLPNSLTTIKNEAFYDCVSLATVEINDDSQLATIGDSAFYGSDISSIVLPNTISSIGKQAFSYNGSLTTVYLPEGLTKIGDSAFSNCNLTTIVVPSTVTSIGSSAFYNNTSLTSACILSTNTTLGTSLFSNCSNLQTVMFYNASCIAFPSSMFNKCNALTTIYVPSELVDTYKTKTGWKTYAAKFQAIS